MSKLTRRAFIHQSAIALGAAAGSRSFAAETVARRSAVDWVTLGKSGVKVTRLGMGTGTNSGAIQRELGQAGFTRLVRHAYDRGIRFFDTADNYDGMHEMLAEALKGVDRDTYVIQTKMKWHGDYVPQKEIDRFRKELNTDYFDSFLLHCTTSGKWTDELRPMMDGLEEAKAREAIRSHGASAHGLNPLADMHGCPWLDVALVRVNHDGTHMDGPTGEWTEAGRRDEALGHIRKIHAQGSGVIGMKLIGNGEFTDAERRDRSIKFVTQLDCVDAFIIGFKTTDEIDEAIERIDTHLNSA
ncbi:MAG: aldo/keto reductase [bacterium]|nr:aldo/keto reductase [bacterium]